MHSKFTFKRSAFFGGMSLFNAFSTVSMSNIPVSFISAPIRIIFASFDAPISFAIFVAGTAIASTSSLLTPLAISVES